MPTAISVRKLHKKTPSNPSPEKIKLRNLRRPLKLIQNVIQADERDAAHFFRLFRGPKRRSVFWVMLMGFVRRLSFWYYLFIENGIVLFFRWKKNYLYNFSADRLEILFSSLVRTYLTNVVLITKASHSWLNLWCEWWDIYVQQWTMYYRLMRIKSILSKEYLIKIMTIHQV